MKLLSNEKKIRVLRVVTRLNIGGPSIHVKNLIQGLDEQQFASRLVTGSVSSNEGDMNYITCFNQGIKIDIPELQREIQLVKDSIALIKLIRILKNYKPDIVHSHTSKAGTIARIAAILSNMFRQRKVIIVHTFHGNVLDGYFNRLKSYFFLMIERFLALFTDCIVAISESQKWELSHVYKIGCAEKIETIKLGFDLSPFINCSAYKGVLRKKFAIPETATLIGIIGRMAPIKNHKMFLDAASRMMSVNPKNRIKFLLVGDGELRNELESYADDKGLRNDVIFYGWEKNIPMIYADLDILALTSLNEGTPVSVIEAMAAKVPVITTGVGGIKDLLGNFDSEQTEPAAYKICQRGILCPKDDSHAFFSALNFMIKSDYLLDRERFLRAQEYVIKNYSIDRLVANVESLYEKLIIDKMR